MKNYYDFEIQLTEKEFYVLKHALENYKPSWVKKDGTPSTLLNLQESTIVKELLCDKFEG